MRSLRLAAAVCLFAALVTAGCRGEDLHTAFVRLSAPDGGTLSGFNCIEEQAGLLRPCLEACYRGCADDCRAAAAEARRAGTAPSEVLAQSTACVQGCFSVDTPCTSACAPASASEGGQPLNARANGKTVCVVVDFLRTGGELECRSAIRQVEWCSARADDCGVLQRRVHCFQPSVEVPLDAGMAVASAAVDANFARMYEEVRTHMASLSESAPDEWLFVRMMATTQERAALDDPRATDLEQVVGCSLSCPLRLDARDTVTLELDEGRLGYCRAAAVRACAALGTPQLEAALESIDR